MAYYLHRVILIALVFAVAVPSSLGEWNFWTKPKVEKYLRDLCSQTNNTKECWQFIKPEVNRFNDSSKLHAAVIAFEPVKQKADEIHGEIDRLYNGSGDEKLKNKYLSCSNNYYAAIGYLELVKTSFDNYDFDDILGQINDAVEELNCCSREFAEKSFDPAHVMNRNEEFRIYLEFLKVATIDWIHLNLTD